MGLMGLNIVYRVELTGQLITIMKKKETILFIWFMKNGSAALSLQNKVYSRTRQSQPYSATLFGSFLHTIAGISTQMTLYFM